MMPESHRTNRVGWLRAAVLGANDGIVSTSSLIVGVAAANSSHQTVVLTAAAGLVAGAMSMAAGEYVSVSSQADAETADLNRERAELKADPKFEEQELAQIYIERGLTPELANEVSKQLMARDALASHARDELGITEALRARPIQAALSSAAAFSVGAALPVLMVIVSPLRLAMPVVAAASLIFLAALGALAAWVGGAKIGRSTLRVLFWGAVAMAATAGIGKLFE